MFLAPLAIGAGAGFGASAAIGAGAGAILGGIGVGLMTASTLMGALMNYEQGQFQAKTAEQRAKTARERFTLNERVQEKRYKKLRAAQIAKASASGFNLAGYMPTIEESAINYETDRDIRRWDMQVEAAGSAGLAGMYERASALSLIGGVGEGLGQGITTTMLLRD